MGQDAVCLFCCLSVCVQPKSASITSQSFYVLSHCKCQLTEHCMNIDMVLRCVPALQLVADVETAT